MQEWPRGHPGSAGGRTRVDREAVFAALVLGRTRRARGPGGEVGMAVWRATSSRTRRGRREFNCLQVAITASVIATREPLLAAGESRSAGGKRLLVLGCARGDSAAVLLSSARPVGDLQGRSA
jgi:hypothetical protein